VGISFLWCSWTTFILTCSRSVLEAKREWEKENEKGNEKETRRFLSFLCSRDHCIASHLYENSSGRAISLVSFSMLVIMSRASYLFVTVRDQLQQILLQNKLLQESRSSIFRAGNRLISLVRDQHWTRPNSSNEERTVSVQIEFVVCFLFLIDRVSTFNSRPRALQNSPGYTLRSFATGPCPSRCSFFGRRRGRTRRQAQGKFSAA
jgi:hypothetical protein